jgi:hypothetical protein
VRVHELIRERKRRRKEWRKEGGKCRLCWMRKLDEMVIVIVKVVWMFWTVVMMMELLKWTVRICLVGFEGKVK